MDTKFTPIDFDALTKTQQETLSQIALNNDGGHHRKVLKALLDKGLIEESEVVLPGRLPVRIKRYHTPLWVHIQWRDWCSRKYPEGD